ncbi:uncharacterized protein LOC124448198 [Xenia sp. Carnegie-2017]|uniref:uncharacterized protein LOC124448198 n=1 Tax=Xenia sp. Carnegie-2017 TaxID=2897299 RepID=UPI001F042217|nr:uncharacterized protein LOC124448198 [Xenia sp. Carnegie-2017]
MLLFFNLFQVTLGPNLVVKKHVLKRIVTKKVRSYVANLMGATLPYEHMTTHSYKGQKGKNGQVKPRLDPTYTTSLIQHATSVKYSNMPRQVIEEDVVKAIKFKLNNKEQAWKKQHESCKE